MIFRQFFFSLFMYKRIEKFFFFFKINFMKEQEICFTQILLYDNNIYKKLLINYLKNLTVQSLSRTSFEVLQKVSYIIKTVDVVSLHLYCFF